MLLQNLQTVLTESYTELWDMQTIKRLKQQNPSPWYQLLFEFCPVQQ